MHPNLQDLAITAKELERLTGFEVNTLFIGDIVSGAYRTTLFKSPKRLFYLCLTQIFVFVLTFILTLPIGLVAIRDTTNPVSDSLTIAHFLQVTVGVTCIVFTGWNLSLAFRTKAYKPLSHLLDEVDKYNDVIQAVSVVDRLEAISKAPSDTVNRHHVIDALTIARNSLVCGLMTEKILRQNRNLLSRRADLLANIENNLVTLRTLEVNNQANDYVGFLNEALQIGLSVHQEMQQLSQH